MITIRKRECYHWGSRKTEGSDWVEHEGSSREQVILYFLTSVVVICSFMHNDLSCIVTR